MKTTDRNPALAGFGGYETTESFFQQHADTVVRQFTEDQEADAAAVAAEVDELRRLKNRPELSEIDYFRHDKAERNALIRDARNEQAHEIGLVRAAEARERHDQMNSLHGDFFREGIERSLEVQAERKAARQDTEEWLRGQLGNG